MTPKKLLSILLALILTLSLAACGSGSSGNDTSGDSGTTPAADSGETTFGLEPFAQRQTLRLGYFAGSPLSLPFYIAEQEGFFDELNIDVVYETFTNGPAMIEANSDWDIAGCGEGGLLVGMVGYDILVIGISDYEENMALFAKAGSNLAENPDDPEAWRGTTWLYPMGTTGSAILAAGLEKQGLTMDDITSINMDVASALTGFRSEGDGLAVWNAIAFAAEDEGHVRLDDAGTLGITFPCGTIATQQAIDEKLDLISYAYILFYKTWEWCNLSDENLEKAAEYYLDNCLEEGVACDESVATRVIDWYRGPYFNRSISLMTDTSPDDAGLYTDRDLRQAEKDILVGMDFFIGEGNYTPEDRETLLDKGLVTDVVALRARAICEEQGVQTDPIV